jgi:hypothetical protein
MCSGRNACCTCAHFQRRWGHVIERAHFCRTVPRAAPRCKILVEQPVHTSNMCQLLVSMCEEHVQMLMCTTTSASRSRWGTPRGVPVCAPGDVDSPAGRQLVSSLQLDLVLEMLVVGLPIAQVCAWPTAVTLGVDAWQRLGVVTSRVCVCAAAVQISEPEYLCEICPKGVHVSACWSMYTN